MRVNQKYFQLFADALIPLLGFFWWNWGLYFIVLFYLLDYLSTEIFMHLKSKKRVQFKKSENTQWLKKGMISAVLLACSFFVIHLGLKSILSNINFGAEIKAFWNYKDMGIEQGYVLLPLIAIVGYQRYKMEFILPKLFQTSTIEQLWKPHMLSQLILIGFSALVIGMSAFIVFPEVVYVLGIVVLSSVYQLIKSK